MPDDVIMSLTLMVSACACGGVMVSMHKNTDFSSYASRCQTEYM